MNGFAKSIVVISLAIGLTGCFEDQPQLSEFTSYLQQEVNKTCESKCKFVSVTKSDGQEQNVMGVKVYEMVANFNMIAQQNLFFGTGSMNGWIIVDTQKTGDRLAWKANRGQAFIVGVRLHFQKFESGWKINPVNPRF